MITMADDLRERLLTTYAHMGEAMVVQNVLQAGGVPCRVADLAHVPSHMLGVAGAMGRSVGLWVLEVDVERATSLLAALATTEARVDEDALAAEALGAAGPGSEGRGSARAIAPARLRPVPARAARSPWLVRVATALAVAGAALLAVRGCR